MDFSEPKAGQTVSHYRLLSRLGAGGMGVVYAAEDTRLGRQVAVKFLLAGRHRRLSRARFLREARSASVLNHPNIATVYDYGETEDGCPFIVMELLRGQTLADVLRTESLTVGQSVTIIRGVLEALCEAHGQGIVHRDIKPSNIAISERGQVKVLDFGLAKSLGSESGGGEGSDACGLDAEALSALPTQTLAGTVLGTPLYISPEQATGAAVDQRSDLFSVGAVLYECLARKAAFAAPSVVEILAQVVNPVGPAPPSRFNQAVPPRLDRVTLKALAKTAERRFQSAEAFLEELRQMSLPESDEVEAPDVPRPTSETSLDSLYRKIVSHDNESGGTLEKARTGVAVEAPRRRHRVASVIFAGVAVLTILLVGMRPYVPAKPIDSIAVLPFEDTSGDNSIQHLNEGLTDSLISNLSRVPGLKVISLGSVAKFKGRQVEPAAAGAELGVQAILKGRVSRAGDEIDVAVELFDTRDQSRLWRGQFRHRLSEVRALQQAVARGLAENLHLEPGPAAARAAAARPPANPSAYELYVKGRWYWNKFTFDAGRQAIQCFQQAIDIDPEFALAYAGLADTYVLNTWVPSQEAYMRANAAAARALELDPTLGEAHATRGFIKSHYERDWAGAEAEFNLAIELSPGYATAHHWYAEQLLAQGRFEQAFAELKIARELDPLSPLINIEVGLYYFYTRDYDRAAEHFKMSGVLFPDFFPTHYYLGWTYTQQGMYAEAVAEYEKALALSNRHSLIVATLGYTYAVAGREAEARAALRELDEISKRKNVTPYRYALLYTGLGDRDEAFKWFERTLQERDITAINLNVTPFSDSLRQDPRFDELVRRMGLSTWSPEVALTAH